MKPRYKWLLFDADHTLLDFEAAEANAFRLTCIELGLGYRDEWHKTYMAINKALWKELEKGRISSDELRVERFARFHAELGVQADARAFSDLYLRHLQEGHYIIDGSRELLESVQADFSLALITNGIRDTQLRRMEVNDFQRYFSHIIISEDAGRPKPHREFFDYALKKIGSGERESMLVIGDSLSSDIQGANNAGIPSCWYNPAGAALPESSAPAEAADGPRPDFQIRSLNELLDIIYEI